MKSLFSKKGAAAVEFALVLPLLLVILFGIIEFSILMYDKHMITNASREGARQGIVYRFNTGTEAYDPLDLNEIRAVVNGYLGSNLISFQPESATTTATWAADPSKPADTLLTVNVAYRYDWLLLPNFVSDLAGGLNLSATTVMRMERTN